MKEYVLGIESTAHTFSVGIVKDGKIIANVKSSYSTEKGGIIPVEAAKHHLAVKENIYRLALEHAGISEKEIKAVAFSQGPGLSPSLLVGLNFTKELAKKLNIPVVPVNHCLSHLEIGKLTGAKNPVLLYVSGANTQIISYSSGKYRIFGETLDIGVGNFIDTFGRYAGLGFPAGRKIEELAKKSKNYVELPYSIKGMDVAFSGMLTNLKQKLESRKYKLEDLSFSLEETAFAMLIEASERAMAHLNKKELLLGGGVACNKRLQEMCKIMCEERDAKFFCPPNELLVDNAGMIAFLGEIMFTSKSKDFDSHQKSKISEESRIKVEPEEVDKLDIKPRQRTDEVKVNWK